MTRWIRLLAVGCLTMSCERESPHTEALETAHTEPIAAPRSPIVAADEESGARRGAHVYGTVWVGPYEDSATANAELVRVFRDSSLSLIDESAFERGNDFILRMFSGSAGVFVEVPPSLAVQMNADTFAVEALVDPDDEWAPPIGYQIVLAERRGDLLVYGALLRSESVAVHPDEYAAEGAVDELRRRAGGEQPTIERRFFRPTVVFGDRLLDLALHQLLVGESHEWGGSLERPAVSVTCDQGERTFQMSVEQKARMLQLVSGS